MNLVNDWKKCWKWFSIQISLLGVVATSLWDYIPALQSSKMVMGLFVLIVIGRIIDQEKKDVSNG